MDSGITRIIARLRLQASALWPEAPPENFHVVRHLARPYSNVYRLQLVAPAASAARFVYAKILTPGAKLQKNPGKYLARLAAEFNVARRLQAELQCEREFAVVKPVAYFPELLAIITEEAPGETIANWIERAGKFWPAAETLEQLAKHCRRAGQALAAIQKATAEVSRFDPAELPAYIDKRLQRLVESRQTPFSANDRREIMKFLEQAVPAIPAEQLGLCGVHGDYAPFNVLATAEKITVADFTMFKAGSVYNDLTYFYHRLDGYLHKPVFRAPTIRHLQTAFLTGYAEAAEKNNSPPLEENLLFRILRIKHTVNNYSAIMRQRVVAKDAKPSLPVQLFNRHVFYRYNHCLRQLCRL